MDVPPRVPAPTPDKPPDDPPGRQASESQHSQVLASSTSQDGGTEDANAWDVQQAKEKSRSGWLLGSETPAPVPGYQLIKRLGRGTYGVVWLAREEATGVEVAIKFFAHGTGPRWPLLQAEVKQLAQLQGDPGIVLLKELDAEADPPYYVMAYAPQGSLAQRLERGALSVGEALGIFRRIAEGLAYVHAKGIRHCDLKPGNILLDARGRPLIADFGQAHLSTDASPTLGTFFYMAPEQADLTQQIPDTRWDVYGLGALFYAMLTGQPPREGPTLRSELENTSELSHRLRRYRDAVRASPKPIAHRRVPGVDRLLAEVVDRCLELDPEKRLRDAGAVLESLQRRERHRQQRPLLIFGLAAPLLIMIALGVLGMWHAASLTETARKAMKEQLKESDKISARLVAYGVRDQVEDRMNLLQRAARNAELREVLRAGNRVENPEIERWLERKFNDLQDQLTTSDGREKGQHLLFSLWLMDEKGVLTSIYPHLSNKREGGKVTGKNYSYRDYFNGKGDQLTMRDTEKRFAYVGRPYISQPFRGDSGDFLFTLSTPVLREDKQLSGVLVAAIELSSLHYWLAKVSKENDVKVVLLNERGHCLFHNGTKIIAPQSYDEPARQYDSLEPFKTALAGKEGVTEYDDPIDGYHYVAGYCPFQILGQGVWAAFVQNREESISAPVNALREHMNQSQWIQLVFAGFVSATLWGWLLWTFRRQERMAHA